jgi:hypothetical protein
MVTHNLIWQQTQMITYQDEVHQEVKNIGMKYSSIRNNAIMLVIIYFFPAILYMPIIDC